MGTTSVARLDQELKNLNRPLSEIYEDMKRQRDAQKSQETEKNIRLRFERAKREYEAASKEYEALEKLSKEEE